jgi:probable rRNA maturation factor
MDVEVVAKVRRRRVGMAPLAAFAKELSRVGPRPAGSGLTIVLLGDAAVRRLNREFRGKDKTTDVLSFPSGGGTLPDGSRPLGEIVISVPQAARQAAASGHALARELRVLLIHGYLHLLGYDHEVDDGRMMRLQAKLARALLPARRR